MIFIFASLKYFVGITILIAFLIQTSSKFIILVNFQLNRKYIAKNLCIKKDIVNNDCEGKCCLKESLNKAEKSENSNPKFPKEKFEFLYFTGNYNWCNTSLLITSTLMNSSCKKPMELFAQGILKPPQYS